MTGIRPATVGPSGVDTLNRRSVALRALASLCALRGAEPLHLIIELHLLDVTGLARGDRLRRRGRVPQVVTAHVRRGAGVSVAGLQLRDEPSFAFHTASWRVTRPPTQQGSASPMTLQICVS